MSDDAPSLQETGERLFDVVRGALLCPAFRVTHRWKNRRSVISADKCKVAQAGKHDLKQGMLNLNWLL